MDQDKTHFRKAFNSPYLSSADIVGESVLTISHVMLEIDKTNKSKELFNTAYFVEKEIRKGEVLKPMILNAGNSKVMKDITGTPFIDDWKGVKVTVYVDPSAKYMGEVVGGLRLKKIRPRQEVTPGSQNWENAKNAYKRDANFEAILKHADISEENQKRIIEECRNAQ